MLWKECGLLEKNITIIGGDLRILNLSQMFAKDNLLVYTYGLENMPETENIIKCETLEEAISMSYVVVTSIPLTKDKKSINSPFSNTNILIDDLINKLENKLLITGNIKGDIKESLEEGNIDYIDLLEREELAILNCISTAEGAIQIAMENTMKTIHGSKVLILGFGRIGKLLSKMLIALGAEVYCEARKHSDLAWIKAYGYNSIHLDDLDIYLNKFDIIMNTIPELILDRTRLDLVRKECLIIDLASSPGGVDFECANEKEIKTIWALALPGKVAPITSAEYIKETIENIFTL